MSGQKKFGAFDGVFTPSILTILGVIMYLRMGWVVGNAGLWGTIIIVLIAHIISFSTGLSISSIATDKKVGAGGVYYVLSRSLGLPIGGAIGLTLFVGTALSISLYLVGFGESFNSYLGLNTDVNGLRSTGSLFLLALTVIALISTSVAIKTQFFILAAIIISLVSVFAGSGQAGAETVPPFGGEGVASMETVFAIFFPAVTGFTAGIAMSGDLKNAKKDLPLGTIASISVGLVVYIALAIFISQRIDQERLLTDYNILSKIALFGPAVIAGVWGATLSSAIGGILGGPRILQAMSLDRITPHVFSRGAGLNNEPRNALILTVLIAEAGILIGELDLIARIVSMFYLAAYGFINISFFLESWASSDFKPSFRVSKWVGLTGFIATFAVMFKLDMIAMLAAFLIIGGVFLWLQRRQISLGTGDVWQSVWSTVVKSGLKRMEAAADHKRNWKPNVILFSGDPDARPYLIEFGKALAGQAGVVTNFDLIENREAKILFPKHKQSVSDELLQKHGVFGRRIEVNNLYEGMETIATTFGFSGLDPNTILMGWARNTLDSVNFTQMTEKLIALDYNVLYLDYDKRWGFRRRAQIDMWWRGISNNAELMLHLSRFISTSSDWRNAHIRVLLVNEFNVDRRIIERRIQQLLDEFRVTAEIKVINNAIDRKPFYQLMKSISAESDLVMIGIPHIEPGKEESFVQRTNDLVGIIGTTLLVKASSTFETTQLGLKQIDEQQDYPLNQTSELQPLPQVAQDTPLAASVRDIDEAFGEAVTELCQKAAQVIQQHYQQWLTDQRKQIGALFQQLSEMPEEGFNHLQHSLSDLMDLSTTVQQEELHLLEGVLTESLEAYRQKCDNISTSLPKSLTILTESGRKKKIPIRWAITYLQNTYGRQKLWEGLLRMGTASATLIAHCNKEIRTIIHRLSQGISSGESWEHTLQEAQKQVEDSFQTMQQPLDRMGSVLDQELRQAHRDQCAYILEAVEERHFRTYIKEKAKSQSTPREIAKKIAAYGQYWVRNQKLLHKNYETNQQLTKVSIRLQREKEAAVRRLQDEYIGKIIQVIEHLQSVVELIRERMVEPEEKDWSPLILHQQDDYTNTDAVLWRFTDAARSLTQGLPQEIALMDEASRNNFSKEQDDRVDTISLPLSEIVNYLIDYHFTTPFQRQLVLLRQQLNQVSGTSNNYGSLLNYGLESLKSEPNQKELEEILHKADTELKQLAASVETIFRATEAEIKEKYEATEALLDIDQIVLQSEELSQHVRKENRRRGLEEWRQRLEGSFSGVQQDISGFIKRKQEEVAIVRREQLRETMRTDADRLRHYQEQLCCPPQTEKPPFYYRQLFSGRHINLNRPSTERNIELQQVRKAVHYQQQGLEGAMMITGLPLSGKSFFVEYISRHELRGQAYRIIPPPGGSLAPRALQRAFEQATGQKGSIEAILQQLPAKSVIILEDIELWWMMHPEGRRPLQVLIEQIERFSSRHHMLMTSNQDAFSILRKHSDIDRALLATVVLSPVSLSYLDQTIQSRHRTGGIPLLIGEQSDSELNDREWQHLAQKFHRISGGYIGVALQQWLCKITKPEEGPFHLQTELSLPGFPHLDDPQWYIVLLQLYLHRSLSRRRFDLLFSEESSEWTTRCIQELKKANILAAHGNDTLDLAPLMRYYISQMLKKNGLL